MRLVHYSEVVIDKIEFRPQSTARPEFKPAGLWVSDEDQYGWRAWCQNEDFRIGHLRFAHEIELVGDNVHIIKTQDQLAIFTNHFGKILGDGLIDDHYIDWDLVRLAYSGLIITPHLQQVRLDYMWYYGWDCASGCIWNPDAARIVNVTQEIFDTCQKEEKETEEAV